MIKKTLLLITALMLGICFLASCSKENEAPEGLMLVKESKENGFKFYGPENWIVINSMVAPGSEVWGAKMSSVNNISITLAKSKMPEGEINAYFEKSLDEFPEGMTPYVVSAPSAANFGNAEEAYKCVYTYKYEGYDFACMQYFIKHGGDFYIFTYTSYGDVTSEESDFSVYLEKVQLAIDSFLFTEKGEEDKKEPEYLTDKDGYKLVSDEKLSGFELYVPAETEVMVSDAYVTAKLSEGASIYLGRATSTGIQISEYWNRRKEELMRIATEVEEIEVNRINKEGEEGKVVLGDLPEDRVASYEYTYVIDGVKYHVYQVMGVDTFNGYVFTYTATEEEYALQLDTINKILAKVKF